MYMYIQYMLCIDLCCSGNVTSNESYMNETSICEVEDQSLFDYYHHTAHIKETQCGFHNENKS